MAQNFKKVIFDRLIMSSIGETIKAVKDTAASVVTKSLLLHSSDPIYVTIYEWLLHHKFGTNAKKKRYLQLRKERQVIPGLGKFSFWYKNTPVWVKIQKESGSSTKDSPFPQPESLTFSISALNNGQVLQNILEDIKNYKRND